jgi:hypothetical protein
MTPEMSSEAKADFAKAMVGELKHRFTLLGELVDKLADQAQQAVKEANGEAIQSYEEGVAVGKQIAYAEAAKALKNILDGGK